jgi:hypothetical protein
LIGIHKRRVWNDANGHALIEAFSVTGMAHGVPLASATTEDSCGTAGAFFLEAGISSTHRIADFWCLGEGIVATSRAAAMDESRVEGRAVVLDGEVVDEAAFAANAAPPSPSFEPNVVLAEAQTTLCACTSATVLAHAIVREGAKAVAAGIPILAVNQRRMIARSYCELP